MKLTLSAVLVLLTAARIAYGAACSESPSGQDNCETFSARDQSGANAANFSALIPNDTTLSVHPTCTNAATWSGLADGWAMVDANDSASHVWTMCDVGTAAAANFTAGTITAALTGNASTATALAADPADCAANRFATAINASGTLTCSQADLTTSAVTGILPTASGGTGIAFFTAAGPSTARVYTFPDAASTIYTTVSGSITSAQLATSLTNETGTGVAVFDTSPTFTTGITSPLITLSSSTAHGVLIGEASSAVAATAAGTASQVLISGGASADPTWANQSASLTAGNGITLSGTTNVTITAPMAAVFMHANLGGL